MVSYELKLSCRDSNPQPVCRIRYVFNLDPFCRDGNFSPSSVLGDSISSVAEPKPPLFYMLKMMLDTRQYLYFLSSMRNNFINALLAIFSQCSRFVAVVSSFAKPHNESQPLTLHSVIRGQASQTNPNLTASKYKKYNMNPITLTYIFFKNFSSFSYFRSKIYKRKINLQRIV